MPDLALDFSFTHPPVAELVANGVEVICVYSRTSTPPRDYLDATIAAGIGVNPIFETAATRSFGGYGAGKEDGGGASTDLLRIGVPDGVRLFVNMADTPNASGNEGAIADYARGFAETFPRSWRLGAYGPLAALRAAQQGSPRFDALWAVETWGAPSGNAQQHFDWWANQASVVLVQMANIPPPIAGTDTNWIVNRDALGAWGDDDMTPDQVEALIEAHVFGPTAPEFGGVSRFDAHLEDYVNKPTAFGLSRFEAWWKAALAKFKT